MHTQGDIDFEELIKIVNKLPKGKLRLLRAEIEKKSAVEYKASNLKSLLLKGPVATKRQLEIIENNRKAINQWRTK